MKVVKESTGLINQEEVDCPLREFFQYNKNCEVDRENNKGLLEPTLYVGSPGSLFVLHKEDHALFSVNTCYHGKLTLNFINHERKEPIRNFTGEKYWCSFDPSYNYEVMNVLKDHIGTSCPALESRKAFFVDPRVLMDFGIPVIKVSQAVLNP